MTPGPAGSQALMRALDLIEAVSHEPASLAELAERLALTKSTTYRLATALAHRGYLAFTPRMGYRLGPRLLELGSLANLQADLIQIARPHLERLSAATGDTVHLGVMDGDQALYLDKMPGGRRITISSRVGDRQPLTSTGLGKALMLDRPRDYWLARLEAEQGEAASGEASRGWAERMEGYARTGIAYDLEENEDQIRCVAAPIRDARGAIIGALSVSSAAQYMDDARMAALSREVAEIGRAVSADLGWTPAAQSRRRRP